MIGQLLRAEDHAAIRIRVESLKGTGRAGVQPEGRAERWLSRLVEEGDSAIEALIADPPQLDLQANRQRLRLLARSARQNPEAKKAKRARRELLRALRALRA